MPLLQAARQDAASLPPEKCSCHLMFICVMSLIRVHQTFQKTRALLELQCRRAPVRLKAPAGLIRKLKIKSNTGSLTDSLVQQVSSCSRINKTHPEVPHTAAMSLALPRQCKSKAGNSSTCNIGPEQFQQGLGCVCVYTRTHRLFQADTPRLKVSSQLYGSLSTMS